MKLSGLPQSLTFLLLVLKLFLSLTTIKPRKIYGLKSYYIPKLYTKAFPSQKCLKYNTVNLTGYIFKISII